MAASAGHGRLAGRRAIVTGAAGGQGAEVVEQFLADGASVAMCDIDGQALATLGDRLGAGARAVPIVADVTDETAVAAAVAQAAAALGGIDVLYNNAGVYLHGRDAPVDRLSLEVWSTVLAINATGPFLFCKHALPHLLASQRGVIVNVASTAAYAGDSECHAYAASKGSLIALTRSIAQRWGPEGLRAITLCPGFIETPMVAFALDDAETADRLVQTIALRRAGQPSEVAELAAFLVSDAASYITSCVIDVHGGLVK